MAPSNPKVRTLLDLSIRHLEPCENLAAADGVTAYRIANDGDSDRWLMWVPDDPVDSAEGEIDPIDPAHLKIQVYARSLGCDYVLFAKESPLAPMAAGLPFWGL